MLRFFASAVAALIFCLSATDNWSAEPEVRFNLLTLPSTRAAESRLARPAQVAYENVTLRACISQLANHYQFSYWLDRRVDSDQRVSLTLRDADVGACLSALARLCNAEMGLIENVVTIAPADRLASMQYTAVRHHDQLSRTATSSANQAQMRPLAWEMLTTPTELAGRIGTNWGFKLDATLPHDLMNEGQLQACTLSTQLTLLLGGFDRCAVGRHMQELRIVPLPMSAPWQFSYARSLIPASQLAGLPAILADYPDARVANDAGIVTVVGPTAAHMRMLYPDTPGSRAGSQTGHGLRPRGPKGTEKLPTDPLAQQRITFKKIIDQPFSSVLTALAKQIGFEVNWDNSLAAADKMVLVTLDANEESLDEILKRLASQSQLDILRQGTVVTVRPRQTSR